MKPRHLLLASFYLPLAAVLAVAWWADWYVAVRREVRR